MSGLNLRTVKPNEIDHKLWNELWDNHARNYRDFLPYYLIKNELLFSLSESNTIIFEGYEADGELIGFAVIKQNMHVFYFDRFVIKEQLRSLEFITKILDYLENLDAEFVSAEVFEKNPEVLDAFLQIGFEAYNVEVWMKRPNTPVDFDYNTEVSIKIAEDPKLFAKLSNEIFKELDNVELSENDVKNLPKKLPGVSPDFLFISYLNETPVGVMYLRIDPAWEKYYGKKRGWILGLGVLEKYQGKGIGRALLAKGINILNEHHVDEIFVVTDFNMGPYNLYKKCGFIPDEKIIDLILAIK